MPLFSLIGSLLLFVLSFNTLSARAENSYDFATKTNRWAFVIGNGKYDTIDEIHSAVPEADKVSGTLESLGFTVVNARDVESFDNFDTALNEFLKKVGEDDFVVFYYSGHGFSYNGVNYLVPTKFPSSVSEIDVPVTFIPVPTLRNALLKKRPGYVLLLLDACRAAAKFENLKAVFAAKEKVEAGWKEPQVEAPIAQKINNEFLYASNPGFTVNSGEKPGPFVEALAKYLPTPDTPFRNYMGDIIDFVRIQTLLEQVPWPSGSSSAQVYFAESESVKEQEHLSWKAILSNPDIGKVASFRYQHSISPYANAARKWLSDNNGIIFASLTRISPLGPEVAWNDYQAGSKATINLRTFGGPLAFPRNIKITALNSFANPDILTAGRSNPSAPEVADIFAKHGKAVLTGPISTVDKPSPGGSPASELKKGTRLEVLGSESDENKNAWLKVRVPGEAPSYVPLPRTPDIGSTNIGKPLKEIIVNGIKGKIEEIVDIETAIKAINDLKAAGRSIEWISVSTPKSGEQRDRDLFTLRAAYAAYMLDQAGVSRRRISVASEDSSLSHDDVRLRIFGN